MSDRVRVAREEEIEPEEWLVVDVDGTSVGVVNLEGTYYAIENECAHLGGPVCTGRIGREVVAEFEESGRRVTERLSDTPTVACPWHGWEYDLASGAHLAADDIVLTTYDVTVEDGVVYIEL